MTKDYFEPTTTSREDALMGMLLVLMEELKIRRFTFSHLRMHDAVERRAVDVTFHKDSLTVKIVPNPTRKEQASN